MEGLARPYKRFSAHREGVQHDQNEDLKHRIVAEVDCNYAEHNSPLEVGKQLENRPTVLFIKVSSKVYVFLLKGFIFGEARPLWQKKSKDLADYQK